MPHPGKSISRINGLVVEYIVAIDVTRVRFPADAFAQMGHAGSAAPHASAMEAERLLS